MVVPTILFNFYSVAVSVKVDICGVKVTVLCNTNVVVVGTRQIDNCSIFQAGLVDADIII